MRSLEESELAFSAYKNWSEAILRKFRNVVTKCDVAERALMEKKMQKLEVNAIAICHCISNITIYDINVYIINVALQGCRNL